MQMYKYASTNKTIFLEMFINNSYLIYNKMKNYSSITFEKRYLFLSVCIYRIDCMPKNKKDLVLHIAIKKYRIIMISIGFNFNFYFFT